MRLGIGLMLGLAVPVGAAGQHATQVLVVVNRSEPASLELGQYYASKRGIPSAQLLALDVTPADSLSRTEYEQRIEGPIAAWLRRESAQDRIHYLVLIKGIPLRIDGTTGRAGSTASVDSELALLYRRLVGRPVAVQGPVKNPYFAGASAGGPWPAFARRDQDIYLVTRLDGFSPADVRALVDRGLATHPSPGTLSVVLDQRGGGELADTWLREAAARLKANADGPQVEFETTGAAATSEREVAGYFSWGSTDPSLRTRKIGLRFAPGAVAGRFLSTDARTFQEPAEGWMPGDWDDRARFFADTPEGLAGDLIRDGITGLSANVAEPYLDAAIRPEVLFSAYLAGLPLADAFYLAMPSLSWQTVVIGDPLCRPFAKSGSAIETDVESLDPATELPPVFSSRRLESIWQRDVSKTALQALLKAESRLQRGNRAGAREVLEALIAGTPQLLHAELILASIYEEDGHHELAEQTYRRVLEFQPNDAIALNNLAYALAVRRQKPQDALPLAQQAYRATKGDPMVGDTLGWIHHLLGDDKAARPYLMEAVRLQPDNAELRLHAAVVLAGLGEGVEAERQLAEALRLLPALDLREEVKALRAKLAAGGSPRR